MVPVEAGADERRDGPRPRSGRVERLTAWGNRHRPEILLVALSIVVPEVLSGSTPVPSLINPFALGGLLGFYGAGSLLVRDVAFRWGRGWAAVLPLGLAYGIAEEGIATKTLVDPHSSGAGFLSVYGRLAGINWVFAVTIALFHAIFSIALPILLVGLVYPSDRSRRFLSDRGELWALAVFVATVAIGYVGFDPHYFEGYPVLGGFVVAIAVLVVAARRIPIGWLRPASAMPTASPRAFLGLGAVFSGGWAIAYLILPRVTSIPIVVIGVEIALAVGVLAVGLRRVGRTGHERHAVYFAAGLLGWYLVWDPIITLALSDYLVLVVLAVVYVGLYRLAGRFPEATLGPLPPPPRPAVCRGPSGSFRIIGAGIRASMVEVGESAPDFEAPTASGTPLKLSSLRGHPVILYFYPQADTPGCTIESKTFRDMMPDLEHRGVRVVGISTDDVPAQAHFAEKCSLPFPLVADSSKSITRAYGVLGNGGRARRVSFFVDGEGRVVEIVDASSASKHTDRARDRYLAPR